MGAKGERVWGGKGWTGKEIDKKGIRRVRYQAQGARGSGTELRSG